MHATSRNGSCNYRRESNTLGDEHRSRSFADSGAFIGDSSTVSQCRLRMKYRTTRVRGNERSDILIISATRRDEKNKGTSL